MNLQITGLKVKKVVPAEVEWNGLEIEKFLEKALEEYRNLVVTEDYVKESKKTMADLNRLAKEIDDFRKDTKDKLSVNIKPFEEQAKYITSMIKEARQSIDDQVKFYEEQIKQEKRQNVYHRIDALQHQYELWEKYLDMVEFKEQYLNLSMTLNKVEADLKVQFEQLKQLQTMEQQKIDTIKIIVDTFNHQLEFKFDYREFDYLLSEDVATISKIVNEKVTYRLEEQKRKLEEIKQRELEAIERAKKEAQEKAEREAQAKIEAERREQERIRFEEQRKHEEELRRLELQEQSKRRELEEQQAKLLETISKQVEKTIPVENEKSRKRTVTLEIKATKEQMQALKNYMDQYNIEYKKL